MIEYNTKRNNLIIREYGRNIQKLVEQCVSIENREERTRTAYAIVRIMSDVVNSKENSNESNRNNDDFWNKLWDHLFMMSNYQLDVDSPYPKPVPEQKDKVFVKPSYNNKNKVRFRTYGVNMQNLINKVSEGYYVLVKFTSGPEFPAELDRIMKITDGILRSLITVVE